MAQGITGFAGGRPKVTPVVRLYSCLVGKALLTPIVSFGGIKHRIQISRSRRTTPGPPWRTNPRPWL